MSGWWFAVGFLLTFGIAGLVYLKDDDDGPPGRP